MTKQMMISALMFLAMLSTAPAQYQGWQHSGSFYILTTPEGANLPATASEENFPVLVRLSKDWFDFNQAKSNGDDIRFASTDGKPLAYQIDEWDAAKGTASIWVRIPVIKGNARQEIKMFWGLPAPSDSVGGQAGKADAAAESKGPAVFNESNGYLSVWHMNDPVKDDVGTVESKDTGTTSSSGNIGKSRHFDVGKGINCGENITTYPTGSSPHSSEVWFKAEQANSSLLAWGNDHPQGKVIMQLFSPPHIKIECWFSGADVAGKRILPLSQWIHVVHTFENGNSRIYVNGVLDAVSTSTSAPLAIKSPGRMYIGGFYNNFRYVGDIDEVRISKVMRSADWVKMQYENQKPLQTMVGPLVQAGSGFSVSAEQITLLECKSATVTVKAGGAQKLYWVIKKDGLETIADVDQFNFTLNAGRVTGDQSFILQCRAVYAGEVKTRDIPVTVKETIPEPVFTLKAPSKWNGRDAIEVVSEIRNLKAMTDKGAGELHYEWTVSGGAVTKEVVPGKLILKRSQYTGPITVKAAIDNGGAATIATMPIRITEPKSDPWVQRVPGKDEKPEDGQFYARDDHNEGTLYYNGTLSNSAGSVFLKLYADDKLIKTESQKLSGDKAYAFTVKIKAGLIKYKVEFGTKTGGTETVVQTVGNLVCGDAYMIEGQSNALATDTGDKSPIETSEWIRSYGGPTGWGDATDWVRDQFDKVRDTTGQRPNLWCNAVWKRQKDEKAELGWWGMELAKRLLDSQKVPICIIQAAAGGTRIDQHQCCATNHMSLNTIYGRMLWRIENARLTHGIRAVLWHQGEADQGSDGPDNGYGWVTYQRYFVDMTAAWKQDMPNIRHYYVFQIWPNGCSQGSGHGDMLREKQRTLPRLYSNMDVMTTLGIKPPGGCHYPLAGWGEFARLMQPLIERDFYGKEPTASITAPDLKRAYYSSPAKDTIALEFDQPVVWDDSLVSEFYLDDVGGEVASGSASGNVMMLKLKEPSTAKKIQYLKEMKWSQDKLIRGANGIAALTFCDVPVAIVNEK